MTAVRVLYLHPFGVFGGATKSLAEMFAALPKGSVHGVALAPPGAAARSLEAAGIEVCHVAGIAQWDDTRFGHYRGLRWLILLRELALWPGTLLALHRVASRGPFDVIHCNEITALLAGLIAKRRLRVPLLVHVRSLQRGLGGSRVSAWVMRLLREHVDAVVAIDDAVRRTLPSDLAVHVVHNGMAVPAEPISRREHDGPFRVAIVGGLLRAKGVYEFVAAANLLRERGLPVKLLVVGENARTVKGASGWILRRLDFARDVRRELEAYVAEHQLQDMVEFTGHVSDIRTIYERIDAVCFPSHADAPGRPVFEAALYALPTIVAMREPTDDVVANGRTGLCIDWPTPEAIAEAIASLATDRTASRRMGEQARIAALQRFDSRTTATRILEIYRDLCSASPARASSS